MERSPHIPIEPFFIQLRSPSHGQLPRQCRSNGIELPTLPIMSFNLVQEMAHQLHAGRIASL